MKHTLNVFLRPLSLDRRTACQFLMASRPGFLRELLRRVIQLHVFAAKQVEERVSGSVAIPAMTCRCSILFYCDL
ncbi:MAG: hypothetical protein CBE00_05505 [Planctomycetaceae bacterium TMED240]|nr:hypothetical protein [Rhodopirellula sp.]OUX07203.1 MAG: hypothetical protein CBE00_05505 [Planctomycetaceae bacterium TMED240]